MTPIKKDFDTNKTVSKSKKISLLRQTRNKGEKVKSVSEIRLVSKLVSKIKKTQRKHEKGSDEMQQNYSGQFKNTVGVGWCQTKKIRRKKNRLSAENGLNKRFFGCGGWT